MLYIGQSLFACARVAGSSGPAGGRHRPDNILNRRGIEVTNSLLIGGDGVGVDDS